VKGQTGELSTERVKHITVRQRVPLALCTCTPVCVLLQENFPHGHFCR
jgi:hypothetical protein